MGSHRLTTTLYCQRRSLSRARIHIVLWREMSLIRALQACMRFYLIDDGASCAHNGQRTLEADRAVRLPT
jgi:hypothetical protein